MSKTKATGKKTTTATDEEPFIVQGRAAKEVIKSIERVAQAMKLEAPMTKGDKRRQLGNANVPSKVVDHVAALADQHGMLLGIYFDAAAARDALAFASSFESVAVKADSLAKRIREEIVRRKARAGSAALAVYATMNGVIRTEEGAVLKPAYDKIGEIMKARRKGKGGRKATAAKAK